MGDAHPELFHPSSWIDDCRLDLSNVVEQPPAFLDRRFSCPGQHHRSAPPIEKDCAKGCLQTLQSSSHGRLCDVQVACSQSYGSELRHRHERSYVIKFHSRIVSMHTIHLQHASADSRVRASSSCTAGLNHRGVPHYGNRRVC